MPPTPSPPPPLPRSPDIDPALAAQLASARPGDRVEALILLKREAQARLAAISPPSAAEASGIPEIVRAALRGTAPADVDVRVFDALGALYVAGPAELLRRLLSDADIVSATLPDRTE